MCFLCSQGPNLDLAQSGFFGAPAALQSAASISAGVAALAGYGRWESSAPNGTPTVISYSFGDSMAGYDSGRIGYVAHTDAHKVNIRAALKTWSDVSGVSFIEAPTGADGHMRFNMTQFDHASGFAYTPGSLFARPAINGDVFMSADDYRDASNTAPGTSGFIVLMHEIGHAIGFKHPHQGTPVLDRTLDRISNTVMSYNWDVYRGMFGVGPLDGEAARHYYGAAAATTGRSLDWNRTTATLTQVGTMASDVIIGTEFTDVIRAMAGDDTIRSGLGPDTIDGGDGTDVFVQVSSGYRSVMPRFTSVSLDGTSALWIQSEGFYTLRNVEFIEFDGGFGSTVAMRRSALSSQDNALQYIASHSDLIAAFGGNAARGMQHFRDSGAAEGRGVTFDGLRYLASNLDVLRAFGVSAEEGARHFIQSGSKEGRSSTMFDAWQYLAMNADVAAAFGANTTAATLHYVQAGFREGRQTSGFDAWSYLATYADLRQAFFTDTSKALRHYVEGGRAEARVVDGFDEWSYMASNYWVARDYITRPGDVAKYFVEIGRFSSTATHLRPIDGGSNADLLIGTNGFDILRGGGGADTLWAGSGDDFLFGGDGDDQLNGQTGNDSIFGDGGRDMLSGLAGNDTLQGGDGDDTLYGGADFDSLFGGEGADILLGEESSDQIFGGAGNDILYGGSGWDTLRGDQGNDVLIGDSEADSMDGGDGADSLNGGTGRDTIMGGEGADDIIGGIDNDLLYGGAGADRFDLRWDVRARDFDTIVDFQDRGMGAVLDDFVILSSSLRTSAVIWNAGNGITQIALAQAGGNYMINIAGTSTATLADQIIWA